MTAGIAAKRPNAVAMRASAIPGATARKVATFAFDKPVNDRITPHTVPKSPTNGVTESAVARNVIRCSSMVTWAADARISARWSVATLGAVLSARELCGVVRFFRSEEHTSELQSRLH